MKRTPKDEALRRMRNQGLQAALESTAEFVRWAESIGYGKATDRQRAVLHELEKLSRECGIK